MRQKIKRLYRSIFRHMPPLLAETLIMWWSLGYRPNIRRPRSFNEKIAHRKIFTRDHRFTDLADKWKVRTHVKEKIGSEYLTEVYQMVTNIEDLDISSLPATFVVKGRHDTGSVVFVDDKAKEDWCTLRRRLARTLESGLDPTSNEYWYADIPRGLIFEERLRDRKYNVPLDFKFYVFHGEVKFVQVIHDRQLRKTMRFYDRLWRPLSVRRPGQSTAPVIARPKQLDQMIEVAEILGADFDFVRIDLYAPNDERVVFGEFTFAPASGRQPFVPRSFDWELGSYW